MEFKFNKTNEAFTNFRSLLNHMRAYSQRNNLSLKLLLKENYDFYSSPQEKICINCNSKCEYLNYINGYNNPCFSINCYKQFILRNKEYYIKQTNIGYYDLYDNKKYDCSFSIRYFIITNNKISDDDNFFLNKNCIICDNLIKDISVFSRDIHKQTCSLECKHKKISSHRRKESISQIEEYLPKNNMELNHYIFKNGKYPLSENYITNHSLNKKYKNNPELQIPKKNSKIYYSKKYNLYFSKTIASKNKNTLYQYLNNDHQKYLEYHIDNNLGKTKCPGCDKRILFDDVFETKLIINKYCSKECYWNSLIGKKVSNETKIKHSLKMKQMILLGKYTPNITNSWAKSKTKVIINGKEKFVRSSWEAVFWVLNPDFLYEKIRIPYVDKDNKCRNYIVDFYSEKNNSIYEIKPKGEQTKENNLKKEKYAIEYCKEKNIKYVIIDENYFHQRFKKIDYNFLINYISNETILKFQKGIKTPGEAAHQDLQLV